MPAFILLGFKVFLIFHILNIIYLYRFNKDKMKYNLKKGLFFLMLLGFQSNLFSQHVEQKSNELIRSQNADFWSGKMFYFPISTIKGTPFLESESEKFSFYYNGKYYDNIVSHFDIVNNEFVIKSESGNWIILQSERIDSVRIGKSVFKHFEYLNKQSIKRKSKIYEVFETSKASLIIDYNKVLEERIISTTLEKEYIYNSVFYIYWNGKIFPVSSAKSIISIFPEKRKELKAYYRENNKYKGIHSVDAIKAMLHYYSEL